jgi:hypothetical protein
MARSLPLKAPTADFIFVLLGQETLPDVRRVQSDKILVPTETEISSILGCVLGNLSIVYGPPGVGPQNAFRFLYFTVPFL